MRAHVIASSGSCRDGNCPTMYRATTGDVVVQGYTVAEPAAVLPPDVTVPEGESVVVIPPRVMDELVAQYLAERASA